MSIVQTNAFTIPSNPAICEKIAKMVQEVSNSFVRIEAEKSLVKETIEELAKENDIPKSYLMKVAKIYHKGNKDSVVGDNEVVKELYESIFKS